MKQSLSIFSALLLLVGCESKPNDVPARPEPAATSRADSTRTTATATASSTAPGGDGASAASAAPPKEPAALPAPPDVAAPPADAKKTASGLATKVLKKGTGKDHP